MPTGRPDAERGTKFERTDKEILLPDCGGHGGRPQSGVKMTKRPPRTSNRLASHDCIKGSR